MGLLKAKAAKKETFAVDIGSSSVKVLQLGRTPGARGSGWSVLGMGHSPISRAVVADKTVVDPEALALAIEQAVAKARIRSRNAITAMPASQATRKTVVMPKDLSEIEQENFMQVEAPNHIPFPLDEVRMDFEILGQNDAEKNSYDVQLVAVKTEDLQQRVDALAAANLVIDVMDIDEFAIERVMRFVTAQNPLSDTNEHIEALIDIGHEFSVLYVLKDGRSIYTREQNFGMKQLTDEVSRRFSLSAQDTQAQLSLEKESSLPPEYHNEVLPQFRLEVASQINRLIQYFFAATSHNRVSRIWISGGGGSLSNISEEVHDLTGVKTAVINPLGYAQVENGADPAYIQAMGPSFLTAFGLAMRED